MDLSKSPNLGQLVASDFANWNPGCSKGEYVDTIAVKYAGIAGY
jgi:hypothetical protein